MYNALSIVIFHFSWKMQSDVWGTVNGGSVSHYGRKLCAKREYDQWLASGFSLGAVIAGNPILRLRSICLRVDFLGSSLRVGLQFDVPFQWSRLLAGVNRIDRLGTQ
jgi:hypothetical protein